MALASARHSVRPPARGTALTRARPRRRAFLAVRRATCNLRPTACEGQVRFCSEAALFIAGAARARLLGCTIGQCRTLFFSGVGCGAELRLGGCKLAPSSGGRFWADEDRPAQLTISVREDGGGGADSDSDDDEFAAARCIGCMQPAALCACEC